MPSDDVAGFWTRFAREADVGHRRFEVCSFGDSPAMADALAALIVGGAKRATAGLHRAFVDDAVALPVVGDHAVVVDGRGVPRCICRTTEVRVGPLDSVDDGFAFDEGEGDRSRGFWLEEHRGYFGRAAAAGGFVMHDRIETVFERFVVVWPLELADAET